MDQLLSCGNASGEAMRRIRRVFAGLLHSNCNGQDVSHEEMLDAAASLDSIAVLEFLTAVEKEFGIQLEPRGN